MKENKMKKMLLLSTAILLSLSVTSASAQFLGNYSSNPYVSNPYNGQSNGNQYSNDGPGLYDNNGGFHGNLNSNQYDPNSVSNPYGQYGSQYSSDSINNPYGQYGSQYSSESPNNPYGQGLGVYK